MCAHSAAALLVPLYWHMTWTICPILLALRACSFEDHQDLTLLPIPFRRVTFGFTELRRASHAETIGRPTCLPTFLPLEKTPFLGWDDLLYRKEITTTCRSGLFVCMCLQEWIVFLHVFSSSGCTNSFGISARMSKACAASTMRSPPCPSEVTDCPSVTDWWPIGRIIR